MYKISIIYPAVLVRFVFQVMTRSWSSLYSKTCLLYNLNKALVNSSFLDLKFSL